VLDRARHVLPRYHERHGEPATMIERELALTMPLGRHSLRMRVDRIDRIGDGAVRVIDYKTSSPPAGRFRPHETLPLTLYSVAVGRHLGGRVEAAYHYVLDRDPVRALTLDGPDVDDQLRAAEAAADGIAAGDHPARPGWHCRTCDFTLICPAIER
jgi:RecB family exonuclease